MVSEYTVPAVPQKEKIVTARATGPFEVKLVPQPADGSPLGRMTIDKQFHGDLEATSKGQMLAFSTDVKDSAGYAAMQRTVDLLHCHVTGRALDVRTEGQHLTLAFGFEIPMELFFDFHPA